MNLLMKSEPILCVGKKKTLGSDNKTNFYTIAIATNEGDAGNLSCTEEVYNSIEPMNVYVYECIYRDGQYKGLRVVKAISYEFLKSEPVKEEKKEKASK